MVSLGKTLKIGLVVAGAVVLMATTIAGGIYVSHIEGRKAAAAYPKCQGRHAAHKAVIQNNQVVPYHTDAKRCDTLTITNLDAVGRFVAFGAHENHEAYDGVSERYLSKGSSMSVTLVQLGNFRFHDHIENQAQGTFTVR